MKVKLEEPTTGINAKLEQGQKSKEAIDAFKNESEQSLNQIKEALKNVQANVVAMETAYVSFQAINAKVTDPTNGLAVLLADSTKAKTEIDGLKTASDEQLALIKNDLSTVQANVLSMTEAFAQFTEIKTKIDDSETGLAKILETSGLTGQEISAIKGQSELLFQDIKKFRDEATAHAKDIEGHLQTSEEAKNKIQGYEEESADLKERIQHIYQVATGQNLANSFDERKKELTKSVNKWLWIVGISTTALTLWVAFLLYPIIKEAQITIDVYTWCRISLALPLLIFDIFSAFEYSKERNLLERYAFKSASALSLEGYISLLINTFGKEKKEENEKKILDFVLDSMNTIYSEPYDPIKESKFSVGLNNKFATLKADFSKTMKDTEAKVEKVEKEVKEIATEKKP